MTSDRETIRLTIKDHDFGSEPTKYGTGTKQGYLGTAVPVGDWLVTMQGDSIEFSFPPEISLVILANFFATMKKVLFRE